MLKPTLNRVIVLPDEIPTATASGIVLVQEIKDPPRQGTVVSIGPRCTQVKEGESVLFPAYGGQSLTHDGVHYLVLEEDTIIGVMES